MIAGEAATPRPEPQGAKNRTSSQTIKGQFRQLAEALTLKPPQARQRKKRRTEETWRGFKLAVKIMRRIARRAPPTEAGRIWLSDTLDWLELWAESEATATPDATDDPTRPDGSSGPSDFSPHP